MQLFRRSTQRQTLAEVISQTIVICYRENIDDLVRVLSNEGLKPLVARATYTADHASHSNVFRCFSGHRDAWLRAIENDGYTLVCEADFVLCIGLGSLPVFWPKDQRLAWGYLYQGSPRLLWVGEQGHLRGHAAPTVCYVINREVAELC